MPRVDVELVTRVAPDRVRAALIDFSERRPRIWPGISAEYFEVYSVGETEAVVREGTKSPGMSVWARERYDWSDPQTVTWTVEESNFCAPGSYVSATITPAAGGGSRIHVTWNRTPTSISGRIATFVIRLTHGRPIAASMKRGLANLEAEAPA
ncbi:MAG: SRPBCC family protein [Chloroflexota bacterium]|nr:SRPBCC family protein [Chloroflexota bacterium]